MACCTPGNKSTFWTAGLDLEHGKPVISLMGIREKLFDVALLMLCNAREDGVHQVGSWGHRVSAGVCSWAKLLSVIVSAVVRKSLVLRLDAQM